MAVILLILDFSGAAAQNSQVLYHMKLPQSHLLNPALRQTSSVYVGLPAVTGITFIVANNFFSFEDLFTDGLPVSESTMPFLDPDFNTEKFLSRIKERNYLETRVSAQMFGVGFSAGKGNYFFIDIIDRLESNIVFPRDMLRLVFMGNEDFAGQTFDLSSLRTDIKYFRETGLCYSKQITERLRIGVRGKIFTGIAAASVENNSLKLTVNNDYTNTLVADMALNISGPLKVYVDSENRIEDAEFDDSRFDTGDGIVKFLTNTKNIGFGADIGAEYLLTPRIALSAAITDLGYIKWKTDITSLRAQGDIALGGMDIMDVHSGSATFEEVAVGMLDSIAGSVTVSEQLKSFRTDMPMGFTAGGKYALNDMISFGALSHSRLINKHVRQALTLSANLNLHNIFSASLAYTAGNRQYDNLGLGLAVRGGWVQFYIIADRIPLSWKNIAIDEGKFHVPANWNTVNTKFGINLLFGNRVGKKDQPVL